MRTHRLVLVLALGVLGGFTAVAADDNSATTFADDSFQTLQRATDARTHDQQLEAAAREQYFVQSFNRLAAALEDFSRSYKATHTIDQKQVKCIREAYRRLEKADPWFRGGE